MKNQKRIIVFLFFSTIALTAFSQNEEIKLDPIKVAKYTPYMEFKHGGTQGFANWKSTNMMQYAKEMWYYSESFYIKRNVNNDGVTMDESQIDITRFENQRKQSEEATVNIKGFKDVIILLPTDKLIYKLN